MTKRLDSEIKAMRAIERALAPLSDEQVKRDLEWALARRYRLPWFNLPRFPAASVACQPPGEADET